MKTNLAPGQPIKFHGRKGAVPPGGEFGRRAQVSVNERPGGDGSWEGPPIRQVRRAGGLCPAGRICQVAPPRAERGRRGAVPVWKECKR